MTSLTPRRPRRAKLLRKPDQKVSASRRADMQPDDLAPAVGVCGDGDYCRHRDDAAALALLQVGGVEPQIRPLATERPVEEGVHALVDLLAELGNLRLADAR